MNDQELAEALRKKEEKEQLEAAKLNRRIMRSAFLESAENLIKFAGDKSRPCSAIDRVHYSQAALNTLHALQSLDAFHKANPHGAVPVVTTEGNHTTVALQRH